MLILAMFAASSLASQVRVPVLNSKGPFLTDSRVSSSRQNVSQTWRRCMRDAVRYLHSSGARGYSVKDDAHDALTRTFTWDEKYAFPRMNLAAFSPSFCSGAVYVAVLRALMEWDVDQYKYSRRIQISPTAWKSLFPLRYKDGEKAWGWANANGPGFAVLVHTLGAGYSFTDWKQAQSYDIIKMWRNNQLGGKERGHIAVFLDADEKQIRFWSSNLPSDGAAGGFGIKTIPRSKLKRVLFTRITNPKAFDKAPSIGNSPWLHDLLTKSTTWDECLKRAGVQQINSSSAIR